MPKKKQVKVLIDQDNLMLKRTIKASVFTDLFGQKRYALRFYQTMHPDDTQVQESDVDIITISNILTDNLYNDLGFMVGDKLMILAEHQAKWTVNILPRVFMYLGHSWEAYLTKHEYDVHSTKKVPLPRVELYMVYTGKRKDRPERISLNEEFWGDKDYVVDLRIKVLYGASKDDIVSQYVEFTHICDEQIEIHGRTKKAIKEIFRICRERNVLTEYLNEREEEIARIMFNIFDAEEALKVYDRRVKRELERKNELVVKEAVEKAEKRAERRGEKRGEKRGEERGEKRGEERGKTLGKQAKSLEIAKNLLENLGLPIDVVAKNTGLSLAEVKKIAASLS